MRKNQIIHVAPWRAARLLGAVGTVVSVFMVLLMFLFSQMGDHPQVIIPPMVFFTIPLVAGLLSVVLSLITCVSYNAIAKRIGGIEYVSSPAE